MSLANFSFFSLFGSINGWSIDFLCFSLSFWPISISSRLLHIIAIRVLFGFQTRLRFIFIYRQNINNCFGSLSLFVYLIEWMMVMIMIMMARSDMNFLFLSLHGHSHQVMNSINDSRLDETILLSTYCGWLVHWILLQSRLCRKKKIL